MNMLGRLNLGLAHRLPMVLQIEASECGLACLAMIAGYHGHHSDLAGLRRRFGSSLKGTTLRDLVRTSDDLGFATRPVRLELEELGQLRTPCILHWDMSHFVVLAGIGRSGALIHDPAIGIRRMSLQELSRHFTGVALELMPTQRFELVDNRPRVRPWQLLGRLTGVGRSLGYLLAMALAIELFAMVSPLLMGWVVDDVLVTGDRDLLSTLVIGFLLLLLLQVTISTMRGWMLLGLNASLKVQSRANLFSHLIALPAAFFDARHLGDVVSRFGSQEAISQALTTELVEAALDGLMALLTLVIMFMLAPGLTLLVIAGAALYAVIRWASFAPLRRASAEAIVWGARRDTHFLESLRGIRTIKLFNGQDERRVHWLNLLVETVNAQLTTDKLRLAFRTARALLLGALKIIVIWLGARRVLDGSLSVGLLIAFIAYKDQFLGRVSELVNRAVELKMLGLHAERLADIALTAPEGRDEPLAAPRFEMKPLRIELKDVHFRYGEQEPWVLAGIDLAIERGESVAIVGRSGCGKSTLLKLLCGLLVPQRGQILVDGEPLGRLGLSTYRSMIGVVMQDDQLFAGSIADNIAFFADRPDQELIRRCARLAAVAEDIEAMPMGYGTLIGDMGLVLSGGQKQRVLIARALYRQPQLLLFDEATSHLDVERERAVNDALRSLAITRIIIAHRPETIRSAERVITLEGGRVLTQQGAAREIA
jgi:ATP-binding cassette subfamily B protein RaxB